MNAEHAEQARLEAHADESPRTITGTHSAHDEHDVGDHQPEQERQPPDRGEQQPVEVAVLDVGDEHAGPRDAGDGEDDRTPAAGTPCSRSPAMPASVRFWSAPMFTTKKNSGMMIAGSTNSGSRGMPRRARPAIDAEVGEEARRAGPGSGWRVDGGDGV